jgi:dehydrogenase/reductase SDR family protein 7B
LQLDLAEPEACLAISKTIQCDILINNGGLSQRDPFVDCDFSMVKYMMNVNCMGPIAMIKGVVTKYLETFNSSSQLQIVNILSVSALLGVPCRTLYCASKFGLDGFGKALQSEVADKNIFVTQIYPSYVMTNISKNAMMGNGDKMGKVDENIKKGIPVEVACEDILKAVYLKRYWVTLGSLFY